MFNRFQFFVTTLLLFSVVACAPIENTLFPTRTPRPTEVPSPTVQWFPPTATPMILPTDVPSPTLDVLAGVGALIFEDDFSDTSAWALATTETRSAAIANGHLTLALSGGKDTLNTLRFSPVLGNFYLETTVQPNLCMGMDEYGILLRATENFDHFRYGISCNGQGHVDRIYKATARAFAPWERFGVLPSVAPSSVRLAVRADGSDIEFFRILRTY
jgi:hypothetical protein